MINIDDLTVKQLREIQAMCGVAKKTKDAGPALPFKVGDAL